MTYNAGFHVRKIGFYIIAFAMLIWFAMFATDLYGTFRYLQPTFMHRVPSGDGAFLGLGYRIRAFSWTPLPGGYDPGRYIRVYPLPYIFINAFVVTFF